MLYDATTLLRRGTVALIPWRNSEAACTTRDRQPRWVADRANMAIAVPTMQPQRPEPTPMLHRSGSFPQPPPTSAAVCYAENL